MGTQLFGRLKPGATAGQADAEAKVLEKRCVDAGPPQLKQFVERSGMTMNVAVALLASYLPARRAARIDPLIALRDE